MERATSNAFLSGLVGTRISQQFAISSWPLPYVVFTLTRATPEFTMSPNEDLVLATIEASLFSGSAAELDDLEVAWRHAFSKRSWTPTGGGGQIKSWISSIYDEPVEQLSTDTSARTYRRVCETEFAYIPS